ncbi:MAG: TonB-dependent receptor, partial [Mucinivorans sp.]
IGNTNLSPEYTNQYDVGITYCRNFAKVWLKRVELQVDAYYNQVQNKIIAMPTSNQFRWTMLNLGYVEILGVDVGLQGAWRIGRVEISTRLNYTYQKAQDFTEPGSTYYGGQIPYVPWHSGGAIVGGSYRGWELNYSFIYTGERYQAVANIPENYAQPWYTHDLSLSRTIQLKKLALRLTGQVNNIFNQPYEVVQCYPMPGTNFKIKINVIL